jgi:hypothetical protein
MKDKGVALSILASQALLVNLTPEQEDHVMKSSVNTQKRPYMNT